MRPTPRWLLLLSAFLACTAAGGAPYAWISAPTEIIAIDVENDRVAGRIPAQRTFLIEASPGRRHAYATSHSGSLVIDSSAMAPVAGFIALSGFQLHPTREEAYATYPSDFPAPPPTPRYVFSTQALAVVGELPGSTSTGAPIAFDVPRERGYFTAFVNGSYAAVEIDLGTRTSLRYFPLPGYGFSGDVDSQAGRLYVPVPIAQTGEYLRQVRVFDLVAGVELPPINVESSPTMVRLNPARTRLFVLHAFPLSPTLWSIDTITGMKVASIGLADFVRSFNLTPAGDKIYIVTAGGVAVIDTELRTSRPLLSGTDFYASFRFIGGIASTGDSRPGPATGLWWNPAEPGWGIHIAQRRSTFFAALFHYDANRAPRWFVTPSCVPNVPCPDCVDGVICQGTVYETNGPAFFLVPFNPEAVQRREAGLMEIEFASRDSAALTYVIGGHQRRMQIRRQVFAPQPALATNYTDLWWNPLESGWGLGITQQSNVMFLAWFVYDESGRPSWYVASNCLVIAAGSGCRGALYRTAGPLGPVPGAGGFDSSALRVTEVGTIDVAFEGANNGTITYVVDGRPGSKAITRQLF